MTESDIPFEEKVDNYVNEKNEGRTNRELHNTLFRVIATLSNDDIIDGLPMEEVLLKLLEIYDVNMTDEDGDTALIITCMNSEREYMKKNIEILLEVGANVNVQCNKGWTPLMWVSGNEISDIKAPITKMLLEAGANLNLQNEKGTTALILACNENDSQIVEILLEAGADPNILNNEGNSALHFSHSNVVRTMLLEHGAEPDFEDRYVMKALTPIMYSKCQKVDALQQEVNRLKRKIGELETKVDYAPGGDGYLETKTHFSSLSSSMNNYNTFV